MLLLDVLNEAIEKAKSIMKEKNPDIDPNSPEGDQLAKVHSSPAAQTKRMYATKRPAALPYRRNSVDRSVI